MESALLDCQGKESCGNWVPHVFSEIKQRKIEHSAIVGGDSKTDTYDHIFKCIHCGAEKAWGNSGSPDMPRDIVRLVRQ
jgi:hypothetical protein